MEKKFVICEVTSNDDGGYVPAQVSDGPLDNTWIDPRHVINEDRLRWGYAKKGELVIDLCHPQGPILRAPLALDNKVFILDPPKPEGDELTKWIGTMPDWLLETETADALRTILRNVPRKP